MPERSFPHSNANHKLVSFIATRPWPNGTLHVLRLLK